VAIAAKASMQHTLFLLGGLGTLEFITVLGGGGFFIVALTAPFFGVRQLQAGATNTKVHMVLSGGFIVILLALKALASSSFLALLILLLPNIVWFVTARQAHSKSRNSNNEDAAP
jgi:hypothetical protein